MALRRKKLKSSNGEFIEKPVRCGVCKENETIYTVHGNDSGHGGKTCCDQCYKKIKSEVDKRELEYINSLKNQRPDMKRSSQNNDMSEAEYQIDKNLFG
jgi:hypothetical protein